MPGPEDILPPLDERVMPGVPQLPFLLLQDVTVTKEAANAIINSVCFILQK
jgi:hypothetical protein